MRSLRLRSVLQSNLLLGGVALISGALAAWMGERQLEERAHGLERDMQQRYEPAAYVVASRDVSRGQTIDASLLAVRSMPKAYAPVDAVAPADAGLLMGSRAAIGIHRHPHRRSSGAGAGAGQQGWGQPSGQGGAQTGHGGLLGSRC